MGREPRLLGDLFRSEELAEALGVSVSTLNRWASRREGGEDVGPPFHALGGKVRRWPRKGVLAWLAAQKR
ncbi:MAG: helix-turn-helix domain-containing protein [Actinomycetia bacterium]|nr:helix-turn-helix domain-containing protein [Actinomycetes bacterium]